MRFSIDTYLHNKTVGLELVYYLNMKEFSPEQTTTSVEVKPEETYWHKAIIAEREQWNTHLNVFKSSVESFLGSQERGNALVLGDASHVATSTLVNELKFERATTIDGDPLVLDDYLMPVGDERYTKVLSTFSEYTPPKDSFDFIYGKSIAFVPRGDIEVFLKRLRESLKQSGLLCAVFTGEGDTWRPYAYTREELEGLLVKSGFLLIDYTTKKVTTPALLGGTGTAHELFVLARRDDTDSLIFTFPEDKI